MRCRLLGEHGCFLLAQLVAPQLAYCPCLVLTVCLEEQSKGTWLNIFNAIHSVCGGRVQVKVWLNSCLPCHTWGFKQRGASINS